MLLLSPLAYLVQWWLMMLFDCCMFIVSYPCVKLISFTQNHFLYDSCLSTCTCVLVCTLSVLSESLHPIGFSGFSLISVFWWAMNIGGSGTHTPYCFSSSLNSLVMCMCYMVKTFWTYTWMPLLDLDDELESLGDNFYNSGVPFFLLFGIVSFKWLVFVSPWH